MKRSHKAISATKMIVLSPSTETMHVGSYSKSQKGRILSRWAATTLYLSTSDMDTTGPAYALLHVNPDLQHWVAALGGTVCFPSAEHLWQSLKVCREEVFARFLAPNGIYARLSPTFLSAMDPKMSKTRVAQTYGHWTILKQPGVVAHMLGQPKQARSLGLHSDRMKSKMSVAYMPATIEGVAICDIAFQRHHMSEERERAVWRAILRLRFAHDDTARKILLNTGNTWLVEQRTKGAPRSRWAGSVKVSVMEDGTSRIYCIHGENRMGKYLMDVRKELQASMLKDNDSCRVENTQKKLHHLADMCSTLFCNPSNTYTE